jgi:uncharacterized protein
MTIRRFAIWHVEETAGYESAWLELDGLALRATGQTAGQRPTPYWLSYTLHTDAAGVTTRLQVSATVDDATHRLDLRRHAEEWTVNGAPRPDLVTALDCDLACSPVTNTMPIRRHGLQRSPGTETFVMAFVQVPTLQVVATRQEYRHLQLLETAAQIRYSSGTFTSDLLVDRDGIVIDYPTMAHRIRNQTRIGADDRTNGPGSTRPQII